VGLTNYFPGSFLDRAVLGTIAAQHLASESPNSSRKPYQRDLSNNQPVTKLVFANVQEAYPFVDAWGGIFWDTHEARQGKF
jgi:hypothetical protein